MPNFSQSGLVKLNQCDPKLISLFSEVVKYFDCSVLVGHRNKEDQDKAFREGKSKLAWPKGKHNTLPSQAIDIAPFPIDFNDLNRIRYFAGFVMGIAVKMNVKLRWGGDWNSNTELKDNTFNDLVHFELV